MRDGLTVAVSTVDCLPDGPCTEQASATCKGQRVTTLSESGTRGALLRPAIVVRSSEDACTVGTLEQKVVVPYAEFFPRPRAQRVAPGHLVAVSAASGEAAVIVWRWFDAVVVEEVAGQVRLWEPNHGEVLAQARDPRRSPLPGSRAYLSSGLEGAEWWMAGPAVARAEDANVELSEVQAFLSTHGLWGNQADT